MRDAVPEQYRAETGDVLRPRHGSHTSQTGRVTSAAIDARDFVRARKDRETRLHLPAGTLGAITGGKHIADAGTEFARLGEVHAKHSDMVLVHDGRPGVERYAAHWADGPPAFQFTPPMQQRSNSTDGKPERRQCSGPGNFLARSNLARILHQEREQSGEFSSAHLCKLTHAGASWTRPTGLSRLQNIRPVQGSGVPFHAVAAVRDRPPAPSFASPDPPAMAALSQRIEDPPPW